MHSRETVQAALDLKAEARSDSEIARRLGISRWAVRDWCTAGKLPHSHTPKGRNGVPLHELCPHCGHMCHVFSELPESYVYLLGHYLGDGCIATHARGVHRLRIVLDVRYPGIVAECEQAMVTSMPASRVYRLERSDNCFEISSYSREWPCLFPQHGPASSISAQSC